MKISALAGVLIVAVIVGLGVGPYAIGPMELAHALLAKLRGEELTPVVDTVLFNIRVPRVLAGALVGGALAIAGATYQSLFRNPLVSPDILGVSAGASLGAVLGIVFHFPTTAIQAFAFAGGLAAVALVYVVGSAVRTRDPILVLVLAGVAIGALFGAVVSLLKILADPYNQLPTITYWLLGSLASITGADLTRMAPLVLIGLVPLVLLRWRINVMSLGDDEARALGVGVARTRVIVIAAATLVSATTVAATGVIGWIGLVVPHLARAWVGPDFTKLAPAALLGGATFLVIVDTLARTIGSIEIPLGVLSAVCGAPFFIWALAASRRGFA
jgi:iron complex transport system permease protein